MEVTALGFCLAFQTLSLLAQTGFLQEDPSHSPTTCPVYSFHPATLGLGGRHLEGSCLGQESWEQSYHPKEAPLRPTCLPSLSATQWQTAEGNQDHCVDNSVCGFAVETMRDSKARGQLKKHT